MFCYLCVCVSTDSKGLSNPGEVEALREKVYASLEAYCKHKYPEQPGRYEHKHRKEFNCAEIKKEQVFSVPKISSQNRSSHRQYTYK